ncbi:hypothetical protein CPB84DRAFT_773606 [Gymnopilus junonius]|uniref:Uncharacterized protein n=1 Tax=Gymnopilus junonius TaxID=109634 RepID=A0A9P5NR46_GYMJU|nr:hypothetical protein CPB84DRAFT_773606 [Gymnopilus junonius]
MPLRLDLPGDTPPLLYHRPSLVNLKRTRSGRPKALTVIPQEHIKDSSALPPVANSSPPKVPNELLDCIVQLYIQGIISETGKWSQKIVFKRFIKDSMLVSKDFRFFILRHFFDRLFFESKDDSKDLLEYLAKIDAYYCQQGLTFVGYSWIRSLCSPSFLISANEGSLDKLTHLKDLCIDFMHSNVLLQRTCSDHLFTTLSGHPIVYNLTSLMLTALPQIDVHLFKSIAEVMPAVTNVHISSTDALDLDCCPECYEESFSRIIHSPIPGRYPHVQAFADAIGPLLAPLQYLSHLYLGVFLSRPVLLDLHARHNYDVNPESPPVDSTYETIYECALCEKGARASTKQAELVGSLVLAQHIKSLRYVGWSSCFGMRLANGRLSKDEENFLEGDSSQNEVLKMSSKRPKGLALNRQDYQIKLTSFRSKTALVIERVGKRIRVTRVL